MTLDQLRIVAGLLPKAETKSKTKAGRKAKTKTARPELEERPEPEPAAGGPIEPTS